MMFERIFNYDWIKILGSLSLIWIVVSGLLSMVWKGIPLWVVFLPGIMVVTIAGIAIAAIIIAIIVFPILDWFQLLGTKFSKRRKE